jgi:hypothetical protein
MSVYTLVLATLVSVALMQNAQAYIDPGAGSMFLQAMAAVFVGLSVALRVYWSKLRLFINRVVHAVKKDRQA